MSAARLGHCLRDAQSRIKARLRRLTDVICTIVHRPIPPHRPAYRLTSVLDKGLTTAEIRLGCVRDHLETYPKEERMRYILVAYHGADDSVSICKRIEQLTDGTAAVVSTRVVEGLLGGIEGNTVPFTTEQAAKRLARREET